MSPQDPSDESERLARYREKRDRTTTNEPFSAERRSSGETWQGRFVVHLHAASRRHFDLRLEQGGVLASFAIPKVPPLDPAVKRLAVRTEDHPLEYLTFEDVIPAGNYGAGAMIVWDLGRVTYLERSAEAGLKEGKVDFVLAGHKLRGRFALVHTGARADAGSAERAHWLLLKKADEHVSTRDLATERPYSVLSGLTVEQRAEAGRLAEAVIARAEALGAHVGEVDARTLTPMMCASRGARLDEAERLYELKLDGVRILADKRGQAVTLRYRTGRDATPAYPEVARAVAALPPDRVLLDGEIVAFDDAGRPSFQRLGRRIHLRQPRDVERAAAEVPVVFLAFDVVALGDRDLRPLPLSTRKELLGEVLPGKGIVRALDHLTGDGRPLFAFCEAHGLEGVVGKRLDSPYRSGPKRSADWVKIKRQREADFVVVGWEESDKARKLRSLVLAAYDGAGTLTLRGKAGSGFDDATIDRLLAELQARAAERPEGLAGEVTRHGKRHWVRPELVASVEFAGLSDAGTLRFPVFRGLRHDVAPEACVLTTAGEAVAAEVEAEPEAGESGLPPAQEHARRATLTNQDKVFWPAEGYTKGDVCAYYAAVAPWLLPLLRDRPLVLVRYPDGIEGKAFFQWNVPRGTPSWLRTAELRGEDERPGKAAKRTFLVDDVDGLLHLANLGCIPLHVLACRRDSRERCDFATLDFDLGDRPFRDAVTLALSLRELLEDLGLVGFPKTSGQSGLHVLVPLGGVSFETARVLTELLGRLLHARHPDLSTLERRLDRRDGKTLIDVGQTGRSRTIVAPYSVRAHPGATVSCPLRWDELHLALDPRRYRMRTVPARLEAMGDPMAALLTTEVDVTAAVAKLGARMPR